MHSPTSAENLGHNDRELQSKGQDNGGKLVEVVMKDDGYFSLQHAISLRFSVADCDYWTGVASMALFICALMYPSPPIT